MASETAHGAPAGTVGSTDTLRKVKEVELDLDRRLESVRAESARALAALEEEVRTTLRRAHVEAEQGRESAVAAARDAIEKEAEGLKREGAEEAHRIETAVTVDVRRLKGKILDTVLAAFGGASSE